MMNIFKGHPGIGEEVSGKALVASDNFSARYDLDRIKGVFSRPQHKLFGESYDGRILVLNVAKGGVATAWMLKEMISRGVAPKAIILNFANPIMAQGAAFANLAMIDRFEIDITECVPDGVDVQVIPKTGELRIL